MTDKKTITQALISVCAEVENVTRRKEGQVGNQKFKYATLEDVLEVLRPLFVKEKLAATQFVVDDALHTILYHESGEQIDFGRYNLGALDKQQSRGSAISYGRRYMLCSIFGIAQEDDDAKAADKPVKNPPTSGEVTAQKEFGTATEFKKYYQETWDAIDRMVGADQAEVIRKRISRVAKVEEQCEMNLNDKLELKLDELHMQGA